MNISVDHNFCPYNATTYTYIPHIYKLNNITYTLICNYDVTQQQQQQNIYKNNKIFTNIRRYRKCEIEIANSFYFQLILMIQIKLVFFVYFFYLFFYLFLKNTHTHMNLHIAIKFIPETYNQII